MAQYSALDVEGLAAQLYSRWQSEKSAHTFGGISFGRTSRWITG